MSQQHPLLIAIAICLAACAATPRGHAAEKNPTATADSPAASPDRLAPLRFLSGHCWRGVFPDGKTSDVHCYDPVYDGAFIRDRHIVTGDRTPYRGETLYSWDAGNEQIVYRYWNSIGGVSDGIVQADSKRVLFPGERHVTESGEVIEMRSVIEPVAPDGYISLTEQATGNGWKQVRRIEFSRYAAVTEQGPAGRLQAEKLAVLAPLIGDWANPAEVGPARAAGKPVPVQMAYRWGPRHMLLRTYESLSTPFADGQIDPVLEGMLFFDHVAGSVRFVASTRYGWTFDGSYAVNTDGAVERIYDVHYAVDEPYIPNPEWGGQVRRFREIFTADGGDRLSIKLDAWHDDSWQPFGPGSYEAVRITD